MCLFVLQMGSSKSKPTVERDESQVQMSDSSSGLHLVEIHSPTVGMSVMTVIFLLDVSVGLWYLCHCLRRSRRLREARRGIQDFPMQVLRAPNPMVSTILQGLQQGMQQQQQQQQLPALRQSASAIDAQVV